MKLKKKSNPNINVYKRSKLVWSTVTKQVSKGVMITSKISAKNNRNFQNLTKKSVGYKGNVDVLWWLSPD